MKLPASTLFLLLSTTLASPVVPSTRDLSISNYTKLHDYLSAHPNQTDPYTVAKDLGLDYKDVLKEWVLAKTEIKDSDRGPGFTLNSTIILGGQNSTTNATKPAVPVWTIPGMTSSVDSTSAKTTPSLKPAVASNTPKSSVVGKSSSSIQSSKASSSSHPSSASAKATTTTHSSIKSTTPTSKVVSTPKPAVSSTTKAVTSTSQAATSTSKAATSTSKAAISTSKAVTSTAKAVTSTTKATSASSKPPVSSVTKPVSSSSKPVASSTTKPTSASSKPPTSSSTSKSISSSKTTSSTASASPSPTTGLTTDQQNFLDLHNSFRPHYGAATVTWNSTLASYAASAAKTCVYGHTHGPYGENIAAGVGGGYDLTAGFHSWSDESQKYNYSDPGYSDATGHFTQIVWKATTQIGCAAQKCADGTIFTGYGQDSLYLVCEYQVAGNWVDPDDDSVTATYFRENVGPYQA